MFWLRVLWLGHSLMLKSRKQNGSHHAELLLDDSEGSLQAGALLLSYLLLNIALSFGPLQMIGCSLPTSASIPLVFCIISSHTDRHRSSLTTSMRLLSVLHLQASWLPVSTSASSYPYTHRPSSVQVRTISVWPLWLHFQTI